MSDVVATAPVADRQKQIDAMKAKWQDPEYRARVAEGRAKAKAAKEAAAAEQPVAEGTYTEAVPAE